MTVEMHVHIESIRLQGISTFDARSFEAAFNMELNRLASEQPGLQVRPQPVEWRVETISLMTGPVTSSDVIGVQIARAVYDQLRGSAG